jgi:thiol:disulfide interchange protein DsbA
MRRFTISLAGLLALAFLTLGAEGLLAQDGPKTPYRAVKEIENPKRWDDSDQKVEVLYFFWYGCPTCKMIDDLVSEVEGKLPEGTRFLKLPAAFRENPEWRAHADLFWALESLGAEKRLHSAVFKAVQPGDENSHGPVQLLTAESQKAFARANKLNPDDFAKTLASPFVQNQGDKIYDYLETVDLNAVPAFIVNGRYIVSIESRRPISDFVLEAERLAKEELAKAKGATGEAAKPTPSSGEALAGGDSAKGAPEAAK